jgi:hypothetical protein
MSRKDNAVTDALARPAGDRVAGEWCHVELDCAQGEQNTNREHERTLDQLPACVIPLAADDCPFWPPSLGAIPGSLLARPFQRTRSVSGR